MKRILVCSDTHCGAATGLTPPAWQTTELQATLWSIFRGWIVEYAPYNSLILNGDLIDGTDARGGGTEQITTDRLKQCEIASEIIQGIECNDIHIVAGTPYHVGNSEDFERVIAGNVGAKFHDRGFFRVNGVEINCKHYISGSALPHTRLTPLAREILQNRQWFLEGTEPLANVIIRSHVHHYEQIDHDGCLGFITPGLQSLGSKYGARICSGVIHFGFLILNISDKGDVTWVAPRAVGTTQRVESLVL